MAPDIVQVNFFLSAVSQYSPYGILTPAQAHSLLGPGNVRLASVTPR